MFTADLMARWQEEYAKRKEPIDSDIAERNRRASDPPKDQVDLNNGGPASAPNPDRSNAPSRDLPMRGSDNQEKQGRDPKAKVNSTDNWSAKPSLDDMQWQLGCVTLVPEVDEHTGVAKWPLSFKVIEKDYKRPNKPARPGEDVSKTGRAPEQPPMAV